jgi:hypothetical protein
MENESEWGMYYTPVYTQIAPNNPATPNLQSQFREGWEVALGLHLLEEKN